MKRKLLVLLLAALTLFACAALFAACGGTSGGTDGGGNDEPPQHTHRNKVQKGALAAHRNAAVVFQRPDRSSFAIFYSAHFITAL